MDMDNTWKEKTEPVGHTSIEISIGPSHPHPPEVQQAARMTVCHYAADANEAEDLLLMLGLI